MPVVTNVADLLHVRSASVNLKTVCRKTWYSNLELKTTFFTLRDAPDVEYVNATHLAKQWGIQALTKFRQFLVREARRHVRYEYIPKKFGNLGADYKTAASVLLIDSRIAPAICAQLDKPMFADHFRINDDMATFAARQHWKRLHS